MAYGDALAELFRCYLAGTSGITGKKMLGGPCFLLHGNTVDGVHRDFAMMRVGKGRMEATRAIEGAGPSTAERWAASSRCSPRR